MPSSKPPRPRSICVTPMNVMAAPLPGAFVRRSASDGTCSFVPVRVVLSASQLTPPTGWTSVNLTAVPPLLVPLWSERPCDCLSMASSAASARSRPFRKIDRVNYQPCRNPHMPGAVAELWPPHTIFNVHLMTLNALRLLLLEHVG